MPCGWRGVFIGLALAAATAPAFPARAIDVQGVGSEGQGADIVVLQLDPDPRPDMILLAYDHPWGGNSFRYRVGRNLDAAGVTTDWTTNYVQVAGLGWEGQGAGAAVAYLDNNAAPELIVMAYDGAVGPNGFRYRVGWNLNAQGVAASWSSHAEVAGVGWEGQGAAVVVGQIDSNPRPDMIFIAYDNPATANSFRYRVGFNVNASGNAAWAANHVEVGGLGWEGQGIGAAITDLNGNSRPDLVLMANDNPAGPNGFRLRSGLDLTTVGTATWPAESSHPGFGPEAQGAGLAIACLDADLRGDFILMSYENPAGPNLFRYRVLPNHSSGRCGFGSDVRKSITDLTPSELASLRRGVRQMMQWNSEPRNSPEFRRSWLFWSNVHAHFGAPCGGGVSGSGMSGVTAQTPLAGIEAATWCRCVHGGQHFLTWHRMYLYYFERALQAAAHDATLRLPFWDIGVDGKIPAAFRSPTYVDETGATVPNPLYVAQRQAGLNAGTGALSSTITNPSGAMQSLSYAAFNSAIESTPHNPVHCATGVAGCGSGRMGHPRSAGLDPIFYAHHANIDRLYQCWLAQNQSLRLPPTTMHGQTFSFVDELGAQQNRTVGTMLTLAQLRYRYGPGTGCPTGVITTGGNNDTFRMISLVGPTRLSPAGTVVPLRLAPEVRLQLAGEAAARAHAVIVIEGLAFDERPGALFQVFLQGPDRRRLLLGVVDFFSRGGPGADHARHDQVSANPAVLTTPIPLERLVRGGDAGWSLVFEPTTGLEGSTAREAARLIGSAANIRFGAARIRIERPTQAGAPDLR